MYHVSDQGVDERMINVHYYYYYYYYYYIRTVRHGMYLRTGSVIDTRTRVPKMSNSASSTP